MLPGSQTLDGVNVPRTYESTLDGNHPELLTSKDLNDNIGEGHEQEMPVNINFITDFSVTAQNLIAGRLIRCAHHTLRNHWRHLIIYPK
ncbi:hypothetical protein M422DRAFT_250385 [Sphaerobolus stellatus SS14]|uniref:Uncharacterized protein n=1 Tax=Sphaerobolus stellatus (strain SS14) TaxID=990650 RepID=A0A0C9USZ7_SPHS4|nr:hypothetical protein M422DRAFT_250385 [Sphaerobolus stellatus SS14]